MQYKPWPRGYFERIRLVFLESWPEPLRALSIPQATVMLLAEEARVLATTPPLWRDRLIGSDPQALHHIAARLKPAIARFPGGAFIRLGSRSPKDSAIFQATAGRVTEAVTAIKLLQTSDRVHADVARCLELGHTPALFVREWLLLSPWQEFRCFMRNRRLVGISQLDVINYRGHPQLQQMAPHIEHSIREFFPSFASTCHLETVVFDVICAPGPDGKLRTRLLELNPWGNQTSPGLFDWLRPEAFDGSFRFVC